MRWAAHGSKQPAPSALRDRAEGLFGFCGRPRCHRWLDVQAGDPGHGHHVRQLRSGLRAVVILYVRPHYMTPISKLLANTTSNIEVPAGAWLASPPGTPDEVS
jgi:hypothetical protein